MDPVPCPTPSEFPPRPVWLCEWWIFTLPLTLSGSELPDCGKFAVWDGDLGLLWPDLGEEPTECAWPWELSTFYSLSVSAVGIRGKKHWRVTCR